MSPAAGPPPPHSSAAGLPWPAGIDEVAAVLRALPPSVGPVRLVGVDGHAGSGKSTFAARLAEAAAETADEFPVGPTSAGTRPRPTSAGTGAGPGTGARGGRAPGGAPVLHLDDLASHDALFGWSERLREQVLEPLADGRTARYAVYDWVRGEFGARQPLPPAPVVVVEGVGAGRRFLRPYLACLLWMDVPEQTAWAGGLHRDGPEQAEFWDGWMHAERAHFAADPSFPYAHFLVSRPGAAPEAEPGTGRTGRAGYEVRVGPGGLP